MNGKVIHKKSFSWSGPQAEVVPVGKSCIAVEADSYKNALSMFRNFINHIPEDKVVSINEYVIGEQGYFTVWYWDDEDPYYNNY